MAERDEVVAGIRAFTDWLEAHPEVPLPFDWGAGQINLWPDGIEGMAACARAMGRAEKIAGDRFFTLRHRFGPIVVDANEYREAVCERRVVGTETVTERVATAYETRTVEREVVEWDCASVLATAAKKSER